MEFHLDFLPYIIFRSSCNGYDVGTKTTYNESDEFLEALYLVNPSFYYIAKKNGLKKGKVELSLFKYYSRFCNRCTPLGLFSGIGVIRWQDEYSKIIIDSPFKRRTTISYESVIEMYDKLSGLIFEDENEVFSRNSTLYEINNIVKWDSQKFNGKRFNTYRLLIEKDELTGRMLGGTKTKFKRNEILKLIPETILKSKNRDQFVRQIFESQLFKGNFGPNLMGEPFENRLVNRLNLIEPRTEDIDKYVSILKETIKGLNKIDKNGVNQIKAYESIKEKLCRTFNLKQIEFDSSVYFNKTTGGISRNLKRKLLTTINVLAKLFKSNPNWNIIAFKEKFNERYGLQSVSLLSVLDHDCGIGYPPAGINLDQKTQFGSTLSNSLTKTEVFLIKKLESIRLSNDRKIGITLEDLKIVSNDDDEIEFQDTMGVLFSIISPRDERIRFNYAGESTGACLISRFGSQYDEIYDVLEEINKIERDLNPGKIIGEIVYYPENDFGNTLQRPSFRDYEIPYIINSTLPINRQIQINDLYVKVRNNRIVLFSESLKREIVPKLSNAHNLSNNNNPIYKFLYDLQFQNKKKSIAFNWGNLLNVYTSFPRVEIEDVIVAPAMWMFEKSKLNEFFHNNESNPELAVVKFLEKYNLPNNIILKNGDMELPFFLDTKKGCLFFFDSLVNKEEVCLTENLINYADNLITNTKGEQFPNELLAILKLKKTNIKTVSTPICKGKVTKGRKLFNDWLYFKIYLGRGIMDRVLTDIVTPLIYNLERMNYLRKWFYIRYNDYDDHIRLRLKYKNRSAISKIILHVEDSLKLYMSNGFIKDFSINIYEKETERYGAANINLAETIFWRDSVAIIGLLKPFRVIVDNEYKWKLALLNAYYLLNDFVSSNKNKTLILRKIVENKMNFQGKTKRKGHSNMEAKYRIKRNEIHILINSINKGGLPIANSIFAKRSTEIKGVIKKMKTDPENLEFGNESLVHSYLHMSINRLLTIGSAEDEDLIFYFLMRFTEDKVYSLSSYKLKDKNKLV